MIDYKARWLYVEKLNKLLVEESDRRLRLLVAAEQTLRNLANGELRGDAQQIASNAAANIRKELGDAKISTKTN